MNKQFEAKVALNGYESLIWEILEIHTPKSAKWIPQQRLEVFTHKVGRLPDATWRFWKDASVDFVLLDRREGAQPSVKLVVEAQSKYHDTTEQQQKDRQKCKILKEAGISLLYARYLEYDNRCYRFWEAGADHIKPITVALTRPSLELGTLIRGKLEQQD